jgi:hypothetical protein
MERIGKCIAAVHKRHLVAGVAENSVGIGFALVAGALDQIAHSLSINFYTRLLFGGKDGISVSTRILNAGNSVHSINVFCHFCLRKIEREHLVPSLDAKEFQNEKLGPIFSGGLHSFYIFLHIRFRKFQHNRVSSEG